MIYELHAILHMYNNGIFKSVHLVPVVNKFIFLKFTYIMQNARGTATSTTEATSISNRLLNLVNLPFHPPKIFSTVILARLRL